MVIVFFSHYNVPEVSFEGSNDSGRFLVVSSHCYFKLIFCGVLNWLSVIVLPLYLGVVIVFSVFGQYKVQTADWV